MATYIVLLIIAIIVIPITFMLSQKKKIANTVPFIMIIGVVIAFAGIFIGQNFPFYYTILVMFGLAFALSVLLDKGLARKVVVKDLQHEEVFDEKAKDKSESQQLVEQESAATFEVEDIVIDKSTDDDLENWMSDVQKNTIRPEGERDRSGE